MHDGKRAGYAVCIRPGVGAIRQCDRLTLQYPVQHQAATALQPSNTILLSHFTFIACFYFRGSTTDYCIT
jgi:hypothetical protein